jgi:hypothetical protein
MATKHPEPDNEQGHPAQTRDWEQGHGDLRRRGSTPSRRQMIDEGLDFVLNHDAELLLRWRTRDVVLLQPPACFMARRHLITRMLASD